MKKKLNVWLILSLFITIFIFSNSIQPAVDSSQKSGVIVNFICSLFNITTQDGRDTTVFVVRKCAHMAEFAALAFCWSMYFKSIGNTFSKYFKYVLIIGFLTACTDEFLQLFPEGRSCELRDVLIDFSGVLIGVFFSKLFKKSPRR